MNNSRAPLRPILLAEDNLNDVELTLSALQGLNLANEIVVVNDGRQALDWLCRAGEYAGLPAPTPALVLLDLKMPRIDGMEVLRQLRELPAFATTPVVILTSSREESDLVKGYQLGVNAYVVKPVEFEEFIAAVNQLGIFWALLNEPPPGQGGRTP
jgi:CheY-like chemotaxis protein